ncbi:MAG: hypothetical protein KA190_17585 [Kofleriaceae bacterium]|nr:hypothetical protein [Kofleriaceae bacterium]
MRARLLGASSRQVLCVVLVATAAAAPALAQPSPAPGSGGAPAPTPDPKAPPRELTDADLAKAQREDVRPWAKGVGPEEQRVALELFNQGNAHLRDALFPRAAETYRQALAHWDHPAIHYNLALALVNLDQPVEMYLALEKAMAYGDAPLDTDKFDRARGYKILVEKQLTRVEYAVDVPDAVLVFDGKEVQRGPGTWSALVRAGEHTVLAKAPGYVPNQLNLKLGGGEKSSLVLKLFTDAELTRYKRRFPAWMPYAVAGAGAAVLATGAILHSAAKRGFADYDEAIRVCALTDPTGGCSMPGSAIFDRKSSAETKQNLAYAGYALGGAALVAGAALVVLNRPSSYRIEVPEAPGAGAGAVAGWSVVPVFSSEGGGVAAGRSF